MRYPYLLTLVFIALDIAGCATMAGDTDQSVSLITTCEHSTAVVHAQCTLANARGTTTIMTPAAVNIQRSAGDLRIQCDSTSGSGKAVLQASGKWSTAGNLIFGGIFGVGVDLASGASFQYPKEVTLELQCPR